MVGSAGLPGIMRILLIEDNFDTASIFQSFLTELGHQSFFCTDGERAIYYAKLYKPDVILMDILLPGNMDGIQATKAINETLDIPIVFLSVHDDLMTEAMQVRNYGFLLKTCTIAELQIALDWAVATHRKNGERQQYLAHLKKNSISAPRPYSRNL